MTSPFVHPDNIDMSVEKGKQLFCLAFKTYACLIVSDGRTKPSKVRAGLFLEGFILEPLPGATATYRRVGRFVVDGPDDMQYFGLQTFSIFGDGNRLSAVLSDDAQISTITIV